MVKFVIDPIAGVKKQSYLIVSFPHKGVNHGWTHRLVGQQLNKHDSEIPGIEYTIAMVCLFKLIEFKLAGTALDAMRSKFAEAHLDYQNGEVIMSFATDPSFSALRKVVTIVSKQLCAVSKLSGPYKKYMTALQQKFDEAKMNGAFASLASGIKKDLECYATGIFRVPDGSEKLLGEIMESGVKEVSVPSGGKAPNPAEEHPWAHAVQLKKGNDGAVDLLIAHQLLHSMQIETNRIDNQLVCHSGCGPMHNKVDKDRIERFVSQKLAKLGPKLPMVLKLLGAQSGFVSASDLAKIPSSLSDATLSASLKKTFL